LTFHPSKWMMNNFLLSHHPDEVDSIASDVICVSAAKHSTAHPSARQARQTSAFWS
jgi:hypothetical protein